MGNEEFSRRPFPQAVLAESIPAVSSLTSTAPPTHLTPLHLALVGQKALCDCSLMLIFLTCQVLSFGKGKAIASSHLGARVGVSPQLGMKPTPAGPSCADPPPTTAVLSRPQSAVSAALAAPLPGFGKPAPFPAPGFCPTPPDWSVH